ncbi:MAG: DsbA family protein [Longimicrobiales bacterium]
MAVAAVALASSVTYRTLAPKRSESNPPPEFVSFWREALPAGIHLGGNPDAQIKLVILSDLECPACRSFHATMKDVLEGHADNVNALYVSYTLSYHRFASAAARAAECADQIGAFQRWVDVIYAKQDSLGLKSWGSYANDAAIPDTASFVTCAMSKDNHPRLAAGQSFAQKLGSPGTPTVILNGWRFPNTPSKEIMLLAIDAVRRGEKLNKPMYAPLGPSREAR